MRGHAASVAAQSREVLAWPEGSESMVRFAEPPTPEARSVGEVRSQLECEPSGNERNYFFSAFFDSDFGFSSLLAADSALVPDSAAVAEPSLAVGPVAFLA